MWAARMFGPPRAVLPIFANAKMQHPYLLSGRVPADLRNIGYATKNIA